jgi:hypothetical protein
MAAVEKIAEPEALSAMVWLRNINKLAAKIKARITEVKKSNAVMPLVHLSTITQKLN